MPRSSAVRRVAWIAILGVGPILPCDATAQDCLDYSDYLHWANTVETPGLAEAISLDGEIGYSANGSDDGDGGSISVLDLATLREPRIIVTLSTPGFALDIDGENGVVCVADGAEGLTIVDASDPKSPAIVGRVQDIGFVTAVVIKDGIALVGSGFDPSGLYAFDISSPAAPVVLDQIDAPGSSRIAIDEGRRAACDAPGACGAGCSRAPAASGSPKETTTKHSSECAPILVTGPAGAPMRPRFPLCR